MKTLDRLFDSYSKRLACALCLFAMLYLYALTQNYLSGSYLLTIERVADIFGLLEYQPVYHTFLGQLTLNYLTYGNSLVTIVWQSLGYMRLIGLVFLGVFLFSELPEPLRYLKKLLIFLLVLVVFEYAGIFLFGMQALNAGDSLAGIQALHMVGNLLRVCSLLEIILLIFIALSALYHAFLHANV